MLLHFIKRKCLSAITVIIVLVTLNICDMQLCVTYTVPCVSVCVCDREKYSVSPLSIGSKMFNMYVRACVCMRGMCVCV